MLPLLILLTKFDLFYETFCCLILLNAGLNAPQMSIYTFLYSSHWRHYRNRSFLTGMLATFVCVDGVWTTSGTLLKLRSSTPIFHPVKYVCSTLVRCRILA